MPKNHNLKGGGTTGMREYDRLTITLKPGRLALVKAYCKRRHTSMTELLTDYLDRLLEVEQMEQMR